jgi:hypothetical protein
MIAPLLSGVGFLVLWLVMTWQGPAPTRDLVYRPPQLTVPSDDCPGAFTRSDDGQRCELTLVFNKPGVECKLVANQQGDAGTTYTCSYAYLDPKDALL